MMLQLGAAAKVVVMPLDFAVKLSAGSLYSETMRSHLNFCKGGQHGPMPSKEQLGALGVSNKGVYEGLEGGEEEYSDHEGLNIKAIVVNEAGPFGLQ